MAINSRLIFIFFFFSFQIEFIFKIEIMLKDPNFNADYVYTGLISPTKQVTNAYWTPTNLPVSSFFFFSKEEKEKALCLVQ